MIECGAIQSTAVGVNPKRTFILESVKNFTPQWRNGGREGGREGRRGGGGREEGREGGREEGREGGREGVQDTEALTLWLSIVDL